MAPQKANYKSYEAQARLVRAIVAAHPDLKLNYKEIIQCYGSDLTEDALNHRLRHVRAQCVIVKEGRQAGLDMKDMLVDDLPKNQKDVDKKNIAKYFGQSTADGIQFQFRGIKSDAKLIKSKVDKGEEVNYDKLPGMAGGSGGGGGGSTFSTPRSAKTTTKRKAPKVHIKTELGSDFEDDDEFEDCDESNQDWSEKDVAAIDTPSKKRIKTEPTSTASKRNFSAINSTTPGQKNGTPTRRAATKAAATIAAADSSHSYSEISDPEPPTVNPSSIFGNPASPGMGSFTAGRSGDIFSRGATDPPIGGHVNYYDGIDADVLDADDGEI